MIFAAKRAQVICDQLKKAVTVHGISLDKWRMKQGNYLRPADADAGDAPYVDFDSHTMHWYGPDQHVWFLTEVTVPEQFAGQPLWLTIQTQIDEPDDGRNPQFLLFVNGEATQGLDMNHREVLLTAQARAGETYRLDLQAYTGILHTEFQLLGNFEQRDPEVEALYYDLQVPLWAFSRMKEGTQPRLAIEEALNSAVNLLDLRIVPSQAFSDSVGRARAYLQKELYEKMGGHSEVLATCIGHTHIDVAWWWTVAQTREKVARSFATVLKLMDEYPDYKFMSSQPQLYAFLKERYPELYAKIKERVREGRWEPEGGMWLEADCNLTSGESLVRQFVHGKRFFREEFGVDNRVLWLPDVFGYSGALPQIMKKCGIDYFMTTKLAWNQFDKIPYDTMMWRGIDGSEVLAHFVTTLGVGQPVSDFFTTYNGMLHPDAIMGGWERYQNKDINNDILVAFGYGDGGGGPTRAMLETSRRMEKGVKGIPKVRQAFAGAYFKELEARVADSSRLPVWEGEFYFEYHRGTYTSMARNKRGNRKSELMLMDLELLAVLAEEKGLPYPAAELDVLWKRVLLDQFHDILPGSAIKEVYDQTKKDYAWIAQKGERHIGERLDALAGKGDAVTLFNTTGFVRNDVVSLGACTAQALRDAQGRVYPVQQTQQGAVAYVQDLPAKGYKALAPCPAQPGESPFAVGDEQLETPFYTVQFAPDGRIAALFDKENNREVLQPGACGNDLRVYEDKPIYFDNWDIDIYYTEKSWPVTDLVRREWTETGPVRATLETEYRYGRSLLRQKIHFYAQSRRIDFETYVDWHEDQQLLKVHFPLLVHTDEASFDIQFGNVTRKVHRNTSWEVARFESCGQKWADLSESGYGVSLLNDCKYGHSVRDGTLALTLIKCGMEPNPHADREEHFFTYSLYPHRGGWRDAGTQQEAYFLNQPVRTVLGGQAGAEYSALSVDCAHVTAETVKKAEDGDGVILRIYEHQNARGPVCATLGKPIRAVRECDLLEQEIARIEPEGNSFRFDINPYEIKTFRVEF